MRLKLVRRERGCSPQLQRELSWRELLPARARKLRLLDSAAESMPLGRLLARAALLAPLPVEVLVRALESCRQLLLARSVSLPLRARFGLARLLHWETQRLTARRSFAAQ